MSGAGVRDPGLQPERTVLAWRRTTLTAVVVGLLLTKIAAQRAGPLGIATAAAAGLAVGMLAVGLHRRRARQGPEQVRAMSTTFMALIAASAGMPALGALASLLYPILVD
ncbi:DUF202 domain-containing protein [Nocardia sp. NPDC024068]|uniref:DUF202 domain-containing protein n=1 Tax=Nocardia sp. NPDC024068 TaxID=3157197 RepID=UPI0033FB43D6